MKIIKYPARESWKSLLERPHLDMTSLYATVDSVLNAIQSEGNVAVYRYEELFDKVKLTHLQVSEAEFQEAVNLVDDSLKQALETAIHNITTFHASQKMEVHPIETMPGVVCWQKAVPIECVGLYVPGGTAPLFSTVLMLGIPAMLAGCREIVICTPPDREGHVNPIILYTAYRIGIRKVFKIGGVQAIGAMAYGTESVPKVNKIFGPGNQYVMAAKQRVSLHDVAIDMPAGPSEVAVLADSSANPVFVAADLLSQAEHGADSQVILITTSESLLANVCDEVERQLSVLPRRELAMRSLESARLILVHDEDEAIELSNEYAPEHLIIETTNYKELAERVTNAGSVFLGHYSPESAGDYASGTNHTLPTSGYAKAYSGVNLDSFIRKITFQEISLQGMQQLGVTIERMAAAEKLDAHKNAVSVRLKTIAES